MKQELIMNAIIFICALIGSVYGIRCFMREKKALYLQMITCGVLSMMVARLFQVVYLIIHGSLNHGFHIGMLGTIGSFLFFFSANYGQMDGLVDDHTARFRKTRIMSLLAPVIILISYVYFYTFTDDMELRICVGVVAFFMMLSTYYNFKHIIIYDVDLGIIASLKWYNILALVYAILTMVEYIAYYTFVWPVYIAACLGISIVAILILPVLKGGVSKWTI